MKHLKALKRLRAAVIGKNALLRAGNRDGAGICIEGKKP
jgi:hypothetical protein